MDFNIPDKSQYSNTLAKLKDLFTKTVPTATTAVGSAIYELLLRPMSIITASIQTTLDKYHADRSIRRLSSSGNTTVGAADDILANYFVDRESGRKSTGVITIYSNAPVMRVPYHTVFRVGDVTVQTTKLVYGVYENLDTYPTTTDTAYVQSNLVGGKYAFNVSVESVDYLDRIIPAGVAAEPQGALSDFYTAYLASALEGGSTAETDAQMVARARTTVCSWQGCSKSIQKLLELSGVRVYSSASFDDADPEMARFTGTDTFVGTSGMIDTYVKTAQVPLTRSVTVPTNGETKIDITDKLPAGVISINAVQNPDTGDRVLFKVAWGTKDPLQASAIGARYSSLQKTTLELTSKNNPPSLLVTYTYMPYIDVLQNHMNRDDIRILGSSVIVRAAVPSVISLYADLVPAGHSESSVLQTIADYVNNTEVGVGSINTADIQEYLSNNLPGAYFKNPAVVVVRSPRTDGTTNYVVQSDNGVVTASEGDDVYTKRVRFFCMVP